MRKYRAPSTELRATASEVNQTRYSVLATRYSLRLFLGARDRHHRRARYFDPQIVRRNPQVQGFVFERDDRTAQAAAGGHAVAGLQRAEHGLPLLLPALLGHDQQEIEDREDRD